MGKNRLLRLLVLLAVLFFLTRLLSRIFLEAGQHTGVDKQRKIYQISRLLCPLDFLPRFEYGYTLLEAGYHQQKNDLVGESIARFKQALRRNPLHHRSHHALGKAYILFKDTEGSTFEQGVAELKKSIRIHSRSKPLALDTARVLMSMWPLLTDGDRSQCWQLLKNVTGRLSWEEFEEIVDLWWLHVKDPTFLFTLSLDRSDFLDAIAERMVGLGAPLTLRWRFLAEHEKHLVRRARQLGRSRRRVSDDTAGGPSLLQRLREVKVYSRLLNGEAFDREAFCDVTHGLLLQRLRRLMRGDRGVESAARKRELGAEIESCIQNAGDFRHLEELERMLERTGFFSGNDLPLLYLKYRLKFQKGALPEVISDIENLKRSISYIQPGSRGDYIKILLLLVDAYDASKLLSIAEDTVRELVSLEPQNLEVFFRLFRIRRILGPDDRDGTVIAAGIEALERSRFIRIEALHTHLPVYLLDENPIEISIDPSFKPRLRDKNIIQVFVDNEVYHEAYLADLPDKVVVPVETHNEPKRVEVEIKFL